MNRKALKTAFLDTVPVMIGYLFLGAGFGILLAEQTGKGVIWAFFMSLFMFAGSGQYLAVRLLATKASLISTAIATLLVNARHIFYGLALPVAAEFLIISIAEILSSLSSILEVP